MRTTLAVVCISYAAFGATQHTRLAGLTCQYVALFALGMLGAAVSFSQEPTWTAVRKRFPWKIAAASLFMLLAAMCCSWHEVGVNRYMGEIDFVVGLWTLALLIVASDPRPTALRRLLSWKPLVFIGTFSYSIYLLHVPLLQMCWQYGLQPLHLNGTLTFCLLASVAGCIVIALSYIFFMSCERPFMNSPVRRHIAA